MDEFEGRKTRRYPRVVSENLIAVRPIKGGAAGGEMLTITKIVGLGGIMFESTKRMRAGQQLELNLLTGVDLLKTVVRVVWCRRGESGFWRVGVEFQDLTEEGQTKLLDALMRRICLEEKIAR